MVLVEEIFRHKREILELEGEIRASAASPARPASLFAALRKRRSRRAWAQALVWKDFNFIAFGMMLLVIKLVLYGGRGQRSGGVHGAPGQAEFVMARR